MKRVLLTTAAALLLGSALIPAQPAEAKSIGQILDSAYNAVRHQSNPNTGYGNLYGNFYGYPYGYPNATQAPVNNRSWLSSFTNRYLGTGVNGQWVYNPYTGQYVQNSGYTGATNSLGSRVRSYAIRSVINRLF